MNYGMAWLVILAAGLLGSGFLYYLTRDVRQAPLKWILRVLPGLLMMAPAPLLLPAPTTIIMTIIMLQFFLSVHHQLIMTVLMIQA